MAEPKPLLESKTMEPPTMLERISAGVCAIGRIDRDYHAAISRGDRPMPATAAEIGWEHLHIHGTAFVVERSPTIMQLLTNRHVVRSLRGAEADERYWAAVFHSSLPNEQDRQSIGFVLGWSAYEFEDFRFPGYQDGVTDLALLTRDPTSLRDTFPPDHHPPIPIARTLDSLTLGARIGVLGYPRGNSLQQVRGENFGFAFTRRGPLLHQGHLSGFAPWNPRRYAREKGDNPRGITVMLTDLVATEGMSGSPVFDFNKGVIGVVFAGFRQWGIGMAIPLAQYRIWDLQLIEFARTRGHEIREPIWPAGDLMDADRNRLYELMIKERPDFAGGRRP